MKATPASARPCPRFRWPRTGREWWVWSVAGFLIAGISGLGFGYLFYSARAALVDLNVIEHMPKASVLYDFQGRAFSRFFDENRIAMPTDRPVPKLLAEAVIATEDRRFYSHGGVDLVGVFRAAASNFLGRDRQGGSTITQQLARNSIGRLERTYDRKLLEIFLAHRIEQAFTKEQILRYYLDRIYFGQGLYGAETTANAFFGVSVDQLSLAQCALLAGMISSPNASSPWKNIALARTARDRALTRLVRAGNITAAQADAARKEPLALRPRPDFSGGFATSEVRKQLEQVIDPATLQSGGLKIYTTIDANLQQVAEVALAARIDEIERAKGESLRARASDDSASEDALEGAYFAEDATNGAIRAIVGSRDYGVSPYNRATQSRRQVGSTLKPLIYAVALAEKGYGPASFIDATHLNLASASASSPPTGPRVQMRLNDALVHSDNYAAMRMGLIVGPTLINDYAKRCGVTTEIPPYPSSYLGACNLSLNELTGIYATLANLGVWTHPHLLVQVRDERDTILYANKPEGHRVFSPQVARQVTGMLQNVLDFGTGSPIRSEYGFRAPAAGKTGTTNDYKDAWFVGYTSTLVSGVWIGYDRPREVMPGGYASKVALPVWATVMRRVEPTYPMQEFPVPAGLQIASLGGDLLGSRTERYYLTPAQLAGREAEAEQPAASGPNMFDRFLDIFR